MYFIRALIETFSFSPVTGPEDANGSAPKGEAQGGDSVANASDTVESLFGTAVKYIFGDHAMRIEKSTLCQRKTDMVLRTVLRVFGVISREMKLHRISIMPHVPYKMQYEYMDNSSLAGRPIS